MTKTPSQKRVDSAGLATGLAAGYGTDIATLFVVLMGWLVLTDARPEITIRGFVPAVRQLPYGDLTVSAASVLGAIVGGYVAATNSRGRERATGIGVAVVLVGLRAGLDVVQLIVGGAITLAGLATTVAVGVGACLGARGGEKRRLAWDRECETLDGWKQPRGGGESSSGRGEPAERQP